MSASPEPAGDVELLRLLDAYGDTSRWGGEASVQGYRVATRQFRAECRAVRAALLAHIAAAYVRRDDPRYRILDRASVTVATFDVTGRGPARAARYSKEELADGSDHR